MSNNESIYIESKEQNFGELFHEHEKESISKKEEIIQKIKDLTVSATNWKVANIEFNNLLREFQQIPYYDQKEIEKLNAKLKEAKNEFFNTKQAYFDKAKEIFKENAIKKNDLIEILKTLSYTSDIKTTDGEIKKINEEFYSIGYAGKEENSKLFNKFKDLKAELQVQRKSAIENLQNEFIIKAERKKELISKLENLIDNSNWKKATEEFNAICEDFKSIGFSGKEGNEEITKTYNEAKHQFFEKRQEYFNMIKAENKVNIEKRTELIEKLKSLYENENWKKASEEVKSISEDFFNVGFCGKDENLKLINEFKEVRDGFYKARQKYFDEINSARANKQKDFLNSLIKNKEDFIKKLRNFIKQDEERLEDFKDRLFNVKPGAKSIDIIGNYQNILEDIKNRIDNNKSKIKEVQDEIFDIRNQLNNLK